MAIHLIKLSVGPDSLSDLVEWQTKRFKQKRELIHITRQTPKRAEKLLAGGSIYWVIKGFICARQQLLELRPITWKGVPHCGLVYDKEMVRVAPRPHRPFQGWRYFDPKDAPRDLGKGDPADDAMLRELGELGLL